MQDSQPWASAADAPLLVDLYQLTMAQGYWREGLDEEAVFSLSVRRLPPERNYLLACGLDPVLALLEDFRFSPTAVEYLSTLGTFSAEFLDWLLDLRFTGDVVAVAEGTPVFADEPILELVAPLPQAQLVETLLMNQIHFQTVLASKASRVMAAASGRAVVEFGLRRIHGADAGLKAARAAYIAGATATSNVLAGKVFGIPVTGTIAHSYIQAHDSEMQAFRAFLDLYPETILVIDTYDTLAGARNIVDLAREMGDRFRVKGVRLDSGDLARLAIEVRQILDAAGLDRLEIFASGGLDEHRISSLLEQGAPIDGFGVGTRMGVSSDVPSLDMAYKLVAYAGSGRLKLSPDKPVLPGRKQIFRCFEDGVAAGDVITRWEEDHSGVPLVRPVMTGGQIVVENRVPLDETRRGSLHQVQSLPHRIRQLTPTDSPYPVSVSERLKVYREEVAAAASRSAAGQPS